MKIRDNQFYNRSNNIRISEYGSYRIWNNLEQRGERERQRERERERERERQRDREILQMLIYPLFASFPFRTFLVETYACGKSNLSFMATCTLNPKERLRVGRVKDLVFSSKGKRWKKFTLGWSRSRVTRLRKPSLRETNLVRSLLWRLFVETFLLFRRKRKKTTLL